VGKSLGLGARPNHQKKRSRNRERVCSIRSKKKKLEEWVGFSGSHSKRMQEVSWAELAKEKRDEDGQGKLKPYTKIEGYEKNHRIHLGRKKS